MASGQCVLDVCIPALVNIKGAADGLPIYVIALEEGLPSTASIGLERHSRVADPWRTANQL